MHQSGTHALVSSTIPAPLLLSLAAAVHVQCSASLSDGSLEVTSAAGPAARASVHLRTSAVQFYSKLPTAAFSPVQHSSLAALLARSLPAAKQQQHIGSSATLAANPAVHGSGYVAHPALVDGCLHMGARLADALQHSRAVVQAWVPVAIGAFCPMRELATADGAWAGAEITGRLQDGSALSSYRLSGGCSGPALLDLADLQAKPARMAPVLPAGKTTAEKKPKMLYKVQWQCSEPLAGMQPRGVQGIRKALRSSASLRRVRAAGSAAASCLRDVTNVQGAMTQPPAAGFFLGTRGVQSQGIAGLGTRNLNTLAEGAAAWGLIRVAASERPDIKWAATDLAGSEKIGQQGREGGDAFGTILDAGLAATPRVLAEEEDTSPAHGDLLGVTGRIVITGGLGGEHLSVAMDMSLSSHFSSFANLIKAHSAACLPICRH